MVSSLVWRERRTGPRRESLRLLYHHYHSWPAHIHIMCAHMHILRSTCRQFPPNSLDFSSRSHQQTLFLPYPHHRLSRLPSVYSLARTEGRMPGSIKIPISHLSHVLICHSSLSTGETLDPPNTDSASRVTQKDFTDSSFSLSCTDLIDRHSAHCFKCIHTGESLSLGDAMFSLPC